MTAGQPRDAHRAAVLLENVYLDFVLKNMKRKKQLILRRFVRAILPEQIPDGIGCFYFCAND